MGKNDKPEKQTKKQRSFWKDFKAELKKVIWPTRSQVVNNTIIVLVIVIIITAICFVLDLAFEALNTYGIDRLKSMVQDSISETNETTDETTDSNSVEDSNNTEDSNSSQEDANDSNVTDSTELNNNNVTE